MIDYYGNIASKICFIAIEPGGLTMPGSLTDELCEYYFKKPASYWSLASRLLREISGKKTYHGQHSFQFNVYPLPKKSTLSNIEKKYGISVKEYHEKKLQVGPKKIVEYLSKRARDEEMLIICSGDEYKSLKPFIEKDQKPISIEGIPDKMHAYKYNYYKAVVYVLPFLSRWKGISNDILKNIAQDIRKRAKNILHPVFLTSALGPSERMSSVLGPPEMISSALGPPEKM